MLTLIVLGLLALAVHGKPPTCAVLFCGESELCDQLLAERWVASAQDEQARHWKTANGAFMPPSCTSSSVPRVIEPYSIDETVVLCIDAWDVPDAKCAFKQCQLDPDMHPELFESDECVEGKRANRPSRKKRKRRDPRKCGMDCDDETNECKKRKPRKRPPMDKDKAACRTLDSWRMIALEKMSEALDAREVGNAAGATTNACAADFIYHFINEWLLNNDHPDNLPWLNESARERQRIQALNGRRKLFTSMADGAEIEARFAQQTTSCAPLGDDVLAPVGVTPSNVIGGVGDDLLFGGADTLGQFVDTDATGEVLIYPFYKFGGSGDSTKWIVVTNGVDPGLRATAVIFDDEDEPVDDDEPDKPGQQPKKKKEEDKVMEPSNACTDETDEIAGVPAFDKGQKVGSLTAPRAFSVSRIEGQATLTRSSITTTAANGWTVLFDGNDFATEFGGQLGNIWFATPSNQQPMEPTDFDDMLVGGIQQRTINELECTKNDIVISDALAPLNDDSGTGDDDTGDSDNGGGGGGSGDDTPTNNFVRPRAGLPLTLAPDVSICVNGTRANQPCTLPSECPSGYACRRKPFSSQTVAYCYDGSAWDTNRVCAFADADEECPFGECVGEVTGLSGGAYPFYYFYKQNDCANNADSEVCADERVAHWQQYGNPSAFE